MVHQWAICVLSNQLITPLSMLMSQIVKFVAAYSVAVVVEIVASIAVVAADIKSIAEAEGLSFREQRVAAY